METNLNDFNKIYQPQTYQNNHFDTNFNNIKNMDSLPEMGILGSFEDPNPSSLKNNPFYKDDADFEIRPSRTSNNIYNFKNVLKKRKSKLLSEDVKLISLSNFQKSNDFLKNSLRRKANKNSAIKYITYEDTFLENEVFIPSPSSYPGDYCINNKLLIDFCEENNSFDNDVMNNSFCYKTKKEDMNIYHKILNQAKEIENNINLDIKNNTNPLFVDEKEIKDKNIEFLKGKNENLEINFYTNTKNKNNISNISLNLFIKKIAQDNFRTKYSLLYNSFLEQFSIFLKISIFIEKIINAFNFYKKENSQEYPELINLLNNIISNKYKLIKEDKDIITKLKNFYTEINNKPWLRDYLKQDTLSINYILFNEEEEEFDLDFAKYSISQRKKNVILFIKEKEKEKSKQDEKNDNNSTFLKMPYFYIFDYSEEEIAISLTSIGYKLICNINIDELLNSNFSKKDRYIKSPNVLKFIERFDKLNLFIIEDICSYDEPKRRAEAITKWVKIAEQCKNLYNYNDTLVINTCFSNYLMRRLVLTWKKIPKSTIKKMNELKNFCSYKNCYLNIRKEIVNRRGRFYVPYLGILLKEIVNLDEKSKYILDNGNINCMKIQKVYIIIKQFFNFKNYPFSKVPLKELNILGQLNPKKEEQIEMLIKKIEPKLIITSGDNLKRKTKTDVKYYF